MGTEICNVISYNEQMPKNLRYILVLMILSTLLPELFSGNTSPVTMLNPLVFILFFTIGYGLPVLVIREVLVRWNLGFGGLFLLGLASIISKYKLMIINSKV